MSTSPPEPTNPVEDPKPISRWARPGGRCSRTSPPSAGREHFGDGPADEVEIPADPLPRDRRIGMPDVHEDAARGAVDPQVRAAAEAGAGHDAGVDRLVQVRAGKQAEVQIGEPGLAVATDARGQ